ncbi:hypothetical protein PRIPAC_75354 [Pristionchus pacificus]|uniref:F-box domain-containing protein n=1 Tax=Pristionchus pacificus TaxID=54126 RepID=A0A2A6C0D6_PRIPA|nr:hypothetical protein PRIPAC_75354 [Pristionchus pacificus]|eukprot:PDM71579.1 hypothetical protein PRIPAC_37986 [Pristionchus pacificus]
MALNILELPLEMVAEVVKHVDYNGLLSLRRTCTIMKELAEAEAGQIAAIKRIIFNDHPAQNSFQLTLYNSKPPLFLLRFSDITKRWTYGRIQHFNFEIPNDQYLEFLPQFREILPTCVIETFKFASKKELYISLFESFLDGLTITEKCLSGYCYYNDKDWDLAYETIKRLQFNTAQLGVHQYVRHGDKMVLADVVDGLILTRDYHEHIKEPASLAVSILARRCFHLELECSWLSEVDVNEAVHKLPQLGKKTYLFTRLSKGVPRKNFTVGTMNVLLDITDSTGEMEIWHDGMRRRDRS